MIHEATTATRVTHPNVDTWTLHLLHSPPPQWTQSNPTRWLSVGLAAPPAYKPRSPIISNSTTAYFSLRPMST
ncbi:hypothetical protein GBA52_023058 [Prunus armeniaca]|nr:hypothetical protein GBA52_023058 [Prunus armeniaca]